MRLTVLKSISKELTLLTAFAACAALIVNALSPKGIALVGDWDTRHGVVDARAKDSVVDRSREVSRLETAKAIYDAQRTIFVDARTRADFENGHIKGAVSLPVGEFDQVIETFMAQTDASTPLLIYCSGRSCSDSHELAGLLSEMGYADVRVFVDGFPAWKERGYPVELE